MADTGNPNFYKNFKGKYNITIPNGSTPNDTIMFTINNILCFLGDITIASATANSIIASLSADFPTPTSPRYFSLPYWENNTWKIGYFGLSTNKNILNYQALNNAVIYFNGFCLNMNDLYY